MKGEYSPLDGQTDIFDFADMFGIEEHEIEVHKNDDVPVPVKTIDWLTKNEKIKKSNGLPTWKSCY